MNYIAGQFCLSNQVVAVDSIMMLRISLIMTVVAGLFFSPPVVASSAEELTALFEIDSVPPLDLRIDQSSAEKINGVRCVTVRYRSPAGGSVGSPPNNGMQLAPPRAPADAEAVRSPDLSRRIAR